jgi:hypothetical protein
LCSPSYPRHAIRGTTVVGLGLDLGQISSQRDLRSGLVYALSKIGDCQHQI